MCVQMHSFTCWCRCVCSCTFASHVRNGRAGLVSVRMCASFHPCCTSQQAHTAFSCPQPISLNMPQPRLLRGPPLLADVLWHAGCSMQSMRGRGGQKSRPRRRQQPRHARLRAPLPHSRVMLMRLPLPLSRLPQSSASSLATGSPSAACVHACVGAAHARKLQAEGPAPRGNFGHAGCSHCKLRRA